MVFAGHCADTRSIYVRCMCPHDSEDNPCVRTLDEWVCLCKKDPDFTSQFDAQAADRKCRELVYVSECPGVIGPQDEQVGSSAMHACMHACRHACIYAGR